MLDGQLDLFSDARISERPSAPPRTGPRPAAAELKDDALIAALPDSSLTDSALLAAEAAKRRLDAAVPALATLCRRFAGFDTDHVVPEQVAALGALASIGGPGAALAVAQIIEREMIRGPALRAAVSAAARLRVKLSTERLRALLQHADPQVRAAACQTARAQPEIILLMVTLLNDPDGTVAKAAACALGQIGRIEARPALKALLRRQPSADLVDAIASVADEECVVLLGRIARTVPALSDAALNALDDIDHPRASVVATAIRRWAQAS